MQLTNDPRIVVVGLGYVGLPLAVALADHFDVDGFDIDAGARGRAPPGPRPHQRDRQRSGSQARRWPSPTAPRMRAAPISTSSPSRPRSTARIGPISRPCSPRPRPSPRLIDRARPATIVYESTVYPGVTEEICGPLIERISGLVRGEHFFLGYSPERINPGDREHTIDRIVKVVAGENDAVAGAVRRTSTAGSPRAAPSARARSRPPRPPR